MIINQGVQTNLIPLSKPTPGSRLVLEESRRDQLLWTWINTLDPVPECLVGTLSREAYSGICAAENFSATLEQEGYDGALSAERFSGSFETERFSGALTPCGED